MKTLYMPLFLINFSLLVSCSTNKENKQIAYSHFQIGVSMAAQGEYEKALEQLLIAKELDPKNELFLNHLGLTYYFMKEYEHSIVAFKSALSENPKYSEVQNNLGRVYIDIKDFTSAQQHLDLAASDLTYPHKDKVWFNMGLNYFMQNKYKLAQPYFLKAISVNRSHCLAYNYFGRCEIELEKFKKAARTLDQAIYHCQQKNFDEPHYYSAIALFRLGYKSKAIARLQESKKLYPNGSMTKKIDEMMNLMKITETK
jgi:type IV pilus assembly protein PilF